MGENRPRWRVPLSMGCGRHGPNHNSDTGVVCPGIAGGIALADAVPDTLNYEVAAIFAGEVSRAMTRTKHATISGTASRAVRDTAKEKGRGRQQDSVTDTVDDAVRDTASYTLTHTF